MKTLKSVLCVVGIIAMMSIPEVGRCDTKPKKPTYHLSELYQIALKEAEQIQLAHQNVAVSQQDTLKARAGYMPKLSTFAGYRLYSQEETLAGSVIQPQSAGSFGLRIDQSFTLNGKEFKQYALAAQAEKLAQQNLDTTTESYLLNVARSYFEVLRLKKTVDIAAAAVERLERYQDAVKTRLKLEAVTKNDLLRAGAELSDARSDLITGRNGWTLARWVLARVVGLSESFDIYDHETVSGKKPTLGSNLDFLVSQAMDQRPEIMAAQTRIDTARRQIEIAKSGYWPSLALEGVWTHSHQDPDSPARVENSAYVGAQIQFPLYDGGFRGADLKQARILNRQAVLGLEDLRKQIQIEVKSAYLDLVTQHGVMDSLEDQVRFAKENYGAVVKQFDYGLSDSLDMLDANTLLKTSQLQLSDARFKLAFAQVLLDRVTGTLWQAVESEK